MIKRIDLFNDFHNTWKNKLQDHVIRMIFKSTSDEDLADMYNLRVLRKGYFI